MTITVAFRPDDQRRVDRATQVAASSAAALDTLGARLIVAALILTVGIIGAAVIARVTHGAE